MKYKDFLNKRKPEMTKGQFRALISILSAVNTDDYEIDNTSGSFILITANGKKDFIDLKDNNSFVMGNEKYKGEKAIVKETLAEIIDEKELKSVLADIKDAEKHQEYSKVASSVMENLKPEYGVALFEEKDAVSSKLLGEVSEPIIAAIDTIELETENVSDRDFAEMTLSFNS